MKEWIASGLPIKFVGDNVDKRKDVRNIHCLLLVVRPRVSDSSLSTPGSTSKLLKLEA